jgi:hypothetical protein
MGMFDGLLGALPSLNIDLEDPQQMMKLQMAMGLLSGAPGQRKNAMADFSHGLQQGLLGSTQASLLHGRNQELAQHRQLTGIQIKQAEQAAADQAKFRSLFQPAPQQGPYEDSAPQQPPQMPQLAQEGGPPQQGPQGPSISLGGPKGMPPVAAPSGGPALSKASVSQRYNAIADQMEANGLPEKAAQYRDMALKLQPKLKDTQTLTDPQSGQRIRVNFFEDGTHAIVPFGPDQEKAHFADTGDKITPLNPFTGAPVGQAQQKQVSPDTIYTGGITKRGQNMVDARTRDANATNQTQITQDPNVGPLLVDKRTGRSVPVTDQSGAPIPSENVAKRSSGAKNVLTLLDQAEKHIGTATNSYVGAAVDTGARVAGYATEGAKSTASLKAIEGALLSQMPRMEGPQSNLDVQMYKQAAGSLGDPTIPRELKQEAIATIRQIQEKYAGNPGGSSATGKIRRYNASTGRIE